MSILRIKIFSVVIFLFCLKANGQTSVNITFQIADSFYFANDWSNAEKLYKQLLKDTSTNSIEWQRSGFTYYNLGKPDDALSNFEKAEATNPPVAMQPYLYSRMAKVY